MFRPELELDENDDRARQSEDSQDFSRGSALNCDRQIDRR